MLSQFPVDNGIVFQMLSVNNRLSLSEVDDPNSLDFS